jgi:hypothetical protein
MREHDFGNLKHESKAWIWRSDATRHIVGLPFCIVLGMGDDAIMYEVFERGYCRTMPGFTLKAFVVMHIEIFIVKTAVSAHDASETVSLEYG